MYKRQTLDIVGAETVTFAEWLQTMRQAQGRHRTRIIHVPFWLAMALSQVGRHFDPMLQPENLRMLQAGYWSDFQPLAHFLGRLPLPANPSLFFSEVNAARGSTP